MPKLPRSTSSATSSMASGTIPSRPAKPYPDRLKIMHLFPDRPLGSLIDATFVGAEGKPRRIEGPAVELLSLSGEISLEENGVEPAGVSGVVGDPTGAIWAGRFVRGLNPVCITIEAVLEELLAAPEEDWRRPF